MDGQNNSYDAIRTILEKLERLEQNQSSQHALQQQEMKRITVALLGDPQMHVDGMVQKQEKLQNKITELDTDLQSHNTWMEKHDKNQARQAGIAYGFMTAWGLVLKFWNNLFG